MIRAAASAVRLVDEGVAVLGPREMRDVVGGTIGDARLVTALLRLFGVLVGLVVALLGGRVLEGLLFGVGSRDLGTLTVAPAVLLTAALFALALPATRASRVDPARCLREE